MTDAYIETVLIDAFLTLNEFSGVSYIKKDAKGKPLNIALPNVPFSTPNDNRFFVLSFLPDEPEPAGLGTEAKNKWTGIFQIDIMVPLGVGKDETAEKIKWVYKLFGRGKTFDEVTVVKTYRAMHGAEPALGYYRTVVRVEFYAFLEKD